MVVSAAPISTTNITGFFHSVAGLSLTKESQMAPLTIGGSKRGRARLPLEIRLSGVWGGVCKVAGDISISHEGVFHKRPQRQRGEGRERTDGNHDAHPQSDQ